MHDRSTAAPRRAAADYGRGREPPADPADAILQDLRLTHGSYCRCSLSGPWGIAFARQQQARFHFVVAGTAWLRVGKQRWVELREGAVVLLPHGVEHSLADRAGGRTTPLAKLATVEIGEKTFQLQVGDGDGEGAVLVCCSVSFELPVIHPLLELMPSVLHVPAALRPDATLRALLDAMADEVLTLRIGGSTVMTRLADVAITRVVRAWMETHPVQTAAWLAAILDPQIGRTLAAIHARPGDAWTVDSLAREARTSRSVFAERFRALVGMPPLRYLTSWRMHVASDWLRRKRYSVAEAGRRLGYESEAAFSRAFKRFTGLPPSAFRSPRRGVE